MLLDEIREPVAEAVGILFEPGQVVEVRVLHAAKQGTISGYFNDHFKLFDALVRLEQQCYTGVYFSLNPCKPELLARSANRLTAWAKQTTSDDEIAERRWLFIDIDAKRPSGTSSTDGEFVAAYEKGLAIQGYLRTLGWPEPALAESGNGAHLLFRVDLPNDESSGKLLRSALAALAFRFDDQEAVVDPAVYNAARIVRAYGTTARKGDSSEARPHRQSWVVNSPSEIEVVPREHLVALAADVPKKPTRTSSPLSGRIDVAEWLEHHGLETSEPRDWNSAKVWKIRVCPFSSEHTDHFSAHVVQFPNGALSAGCHHRSCADKDWRDLRDLLEPGWRASTDATSFASQVPEVPEPLIPAFPLAVFPRPIRDYIQEYAEAMGVPPGLIAVPMLASLASAIGSSRVVEIKESWTEPCVIWTAIVAPPGSLKSPSLSKALRGPRRRQSQLRREFEELTAAYDALPEELRGSKAPRLKQVEVNDTTIEALVEVLHSSPHGVLVFQDELAALARSFNQYEGGQGADRQKWSSFWTASQVLVNRSGATAAFVERPTVSITGAIPIEVLGDLEDLKKREDGFTHRFLYACPNLERQHWRDSSVSPSTVADHDRFFEDLYSACEAPLNGNSEPKNIRLTAEALDEFIGFFNDLVDEMHKAPLRLQGPLSKLHGYAARIALVLHTTAWVAGETDEEEIDESIMAAAIELTDYFKANARSVFRRLKQSDDAAKLERALAWIRNNDGEASSRDLVTAHICKKADEAISVLDQLAEAGLGSVEKIQPKTRGKPRIIFPLDQKSKL